VRGRERLHAEFAKPAEDRGNKSRRTREHPATAAQRPTKAAVRKSRCGPFRADSRGDRPSLSGR